MPSKENDVMCENDKFHRKLAELAGETIAMMIIENANSLEDLNNGLRINRKAIDWLGQNHKDIWDVLKTKTQQRRTEFSLTSSLNKKFD